MKKRGILNAELSEAVARMGHGDIIIIGDVGCPFPRHDITTCIDLAVTDGIPMVKDVLNVVLEELEVEEYYVAEEIKSAHSNTYKDFVDIISKFTNKDMPITEKTFSHVKLKDLWLNGALNGEEVKVFVRCGQKTPYGYIALVAGVDF